MRRRLCAGRNRKAAASAIIAPLSVHSASSGSARGRAFSRRPRSAANAAAFAPRRRRPPADRARSASAPPWTWHQHRRRWPAAWTRSARDPCWHTFVPSLARAHRGLEAGEGEVEVAAVQHGRGRSKATASPNSASRASAGPPGSPGPSAWPTCRRPRRPRRRWSRRAVRTAPRRRRISCVAAGHEQRHEGNCGGSAERKGEQMPFQVVHRQHRFAERGGQRQATPAHQQRAGEAGPCVYATTSMSASVRPAEVITWRTSGSTRRM